MVSFHWAYILPSGIALIVGVYLSAKIQSKRLMLFCYGFASTYLGVLAWCFDLNLSRFGYSDRHSWLGSAIFILIGLMFLVSAILRSRAGMIRSINSMEKPLDYDVSGKPDITPEERVNRARNNQD